MIILDGAMGTELFRRGIGFERCYDALNLSDPDVVLAVHSSYVEAGAEVIGTNTFGANREVLARFGLSEDIAAIQRAGVRLAREAAGSRARVAGTIGPIGDPTEQASLLCEAGVDLLLLETYFQLEAVCAAILACRAVAGDGMMLVAQVTVNELGNLLDGTTPEELIEKLNDLPVDVVGVNCSMGPDSVLRAVERMAPLTSKPMSAVPSAGLPVDGVYPCTPDAFGEFARRASLLGVEMMGGCCGTTPEHIAAARGTIQYPAGCGVR